MLSTCNRYYESRDGCLNRHDQLLAQLTYTHIGQADTLSASSVNNACDESVTRLSVYECSTLHSGDTCRVDSDSDLGSWCHNTFSHSDETRNGRPIVIVVVVSVVFVISVFFCPWYCCRRHRCC